MKNTPSSPENACASCCGSDQNGQSVEPSKMTQRQNRASGSAYRIATMDCSAEESEIRRALEPIDGIRSLNFQLSARTLVIDAPGDVLPLALTAIRKVGFDPREMPAMDEGGDSSGAHSGHEHGFSSGIPRLVLALVFALGAESLAFFAPETRVWQVAGMAIAAIGIWLAGLDTYTKGFSALRHARLNINALMSVAVTGAFLLGQWAEAAMVMALYALAELIEARAVDRARNAIKGLLDLAPETAEVRQAGGNWKTTPARDVTLGAIVRIKPGERVALDGTVTAGASAINQAPVTGESIPVEKSVGDPVYAGTINESGSLEFEVTAVASDSTLARITHAVEQAQGSRAPTQRFVDKFAAIYTPTVFVMALVVALGGPLVFDWTWLQAVYKALVLLVIACPCALVISTPVTVVSGLAAAARRGILIKGGTYLEEARKLKAVALDKTGTITAGKPELVAWELIAPVSTKETVAAMAASLASRSDHPVSKAIAKGLNPTVNEVAGFEAIPGRGVKGTVAGVDYVLGNHRLIKERDQSSAELDALLRIYEEAGRTVTLLASNESVLALFAVADTIKQSSRAAMADLKALGVTPVMLTGDNSATAQSIGHQTGIADVRGNLLPEDKLDAIREMQTQYGLTGMTGDGINDAPALAQADIGFAMGAAGTDIAMEAADVVIMNDDLHQIATTVELSRKTHAVLWQNITLALGIKVVFFYLAIFYGATMWMAVFADMGASLLVVANGLRLLRYGKKTGTRLASSGASSLKPKQAAG
ncbi:heavy metal translocating P-type ATPase [Allopusillimonas ginsengisoli]|uniref:heavy metal translocating P-type ATPase n=1 Tax=Allopusillimonas ginsengisoli TaxID=453575 RepID=UPI0039C2AA2E